MKIKRPVKRGLQRRPYLSSVIIEGLQSIAGRTAPETTSEARALLWVTRAAAWRVECEAMDSHDASVSPSTRDAGRSRSAPADGGAA